MGVPAQEQSLPEERASEPIKLHRSAHGYSIGPVTMAGFLTLVQAVQLPVAEAQSGYPSSIYPGSLQVGVDHRPVLFPNHTEGESPAHDGGERTTQQRSSNPSGFVCCVSPEGRSAGLPE